MRPFPFALALLLPTLALAQQRDEQGREIRYLEEEVIDFVDPVDVNGAVVGPDGTVVRSARPKQGFAWIELREDFDREMAESVDEIE